MFDVQKSIEAQRSYCSKKNLPHFAPDSGRCWDCNQQIYSTGKHKFSERVSEGISVEKAGSELITGCPHCNRSYCD